MSISFSTFSIVVLGLLAVAAYMWQRMDRKNRHLQANCKQARSDLDYITDCLNSGLMIVGRQGQIETINPAAANILDLNDPEPVGKSINDILQSGHYEFTRCIAHVLSGGESIHRREIEITRGDAKMPVGISVNRMGDEYDGLGAVAIFQDLSDVVRMREQVREADRLAAVGELSASIAHEIRNPLGSIRGSAEMLAADLDLDGSDQKLLQLILKESRRVNNIITNFLAYARQPLMNPTLIGIQGLFEDLALQTRMNGERTTQSVRIAVDVFPDDMLLFADEEQLRQVMLNLAQNAVEACGPHGEIWLEAELDVPGKQALLRVRDNGPGVPIETRERIFEPFHTDKQAGTGLGLPIVKRIVLAHGGVIRIKDARDGGAVFEVVLPLTKHSLHDVYATGDSILPDGVTLGDPA
jgi:two-component system, NtrC family, sensor histidine kinase PilS